MADYDARLSSLIEGEPIYLQGVESYDPDGGSLSYAWTVFALPSEPDAEEGESDDAEGADSVVEEIFSSEVSPSYTPALPGTYTFSLVVSDGMYESDSSHLTVEVSSLPVPPEDESSDGE